MALPVSRCRSPGHRQIPTVKFLVCAILNERLPFHFLRSPFLPPSFPSHPFCSRIKLAREFTFNRGHPIRLALLSWKSSGPRWSVPLFFVFARIALMIKLIASNLSEHEDEARRTLCYFLRPQRIASGISTDANTSARTRGGDVSANPRNDFARVRGTSWQRRRHFHPVA